MAQHAPACLALVEGGQKGNLTLDRVRCFKGMGVRIGVDCEGILVVAGAHDEKQSVLVTEVINELSTIAGTLAKGAFCVADRVVDDDSALCLGCRTIQSRSEEHTSELQTLMRRSYAV